MEYYIMNAINSKGDSDEWKQVDGIFWPLSWIRNYDAYSAKTTLLPSGGFVCEEIDKRGNYSKTEYSSGVVTKRAFGRAVDFRDDIIAAFGLAWTGSELLVLTGGHDSDGVPYFTRDEFDYGTLTVVDNSPGTVK